MKKEKLIFLENKAQAEEYLKNLNKFKEEFPISFTFEVEKLFKKKGISFKTEEEYEKDISIYKGIHKSSFEITSKICKRLKIDYREINLFSLFYFDIFLILSSSKKYLKLLEEIIKKETPEKIISFKSENPLFSDKEFSQMIIPSIFNGEQSFEDYLLPNKKEIREKILFRFVSLIQRIIVKSKLRMCPRNINKIFISGGKNYFGSLVKDLHPNKKNRIFNFDYCLRKSYFVNKRYIPFYEFSGKKSKRQNTLEEDILDLKQDIIELDFSKEFGTEFGIEEILKKKLISLIETKFMWMSRYIEEVYELMEKNKVNLVISTDDYMPMVMVAKRFNIPSILFEHGFNAYEEAYRSISDYVLTSGEEMKKYHVKSGIIKENVIVTGCPRYDKVIPTKKEKEKIIVYVMEVTNGNNVVADTHLSKKRQKELLRILFNVLKKFPEYKLIIKVRPNWELTDIPKIVAQQEGYKNFIVIEETDNIKLMNRADIVIINRSTLGIEALLLNKPVISLYFKDLDKYNPYLKMDIKKVYNEKQLGDEIKRSINKKGDKEVLSEYFLTDRKSTERAVNFINKILEHSH